MPITNDEEDWADALPERRSREFRYSRGYVRHALADLFQVPALDVPLQSAPGRPSQLAEGWGFISFSHCRDSLFVGWSSSRIGVDLERVDRQFCADRLVRRYFPTKEQVEVAFLDEDDFQKVVLEKWLTKEAAIKWQRGKISKDLRHWCCLESSSLVSHDFLSYELVVHRLHYGEWSMAVVSDVMTITNPPIICIS